jgi:hypothetical protein
MIESRKMRWAKHANRMGRKGMHILFLWNIQKETDNWEELHVRGRIIIK